MCPSRSAARATVWAWSLERSSSASKPLCHGNDARGSDVTVASISSRVSTATASTTLAIPAWPARDCARRRTATVRPMSLSIARASGLRPSGPDASGSGEGLLTGGGERRHDVEPGERGAQVAYGFRRPRHFVRALPAGAVGCGRMGRGPSLAGEGGREAVGDSGVELRFAVAADEVERALGADTPALRAIGGDRHERVADHDHAAGQGNGVAAKSVGVTRAIPSLVMRAHACGGGDHGRQRLQHRGPDRGMTVQEGLITGGQRTGVRDHVVRQPDHPDVPNPRAHVDRESLVIVEPEQAADLRSELADQGASPCKCQVRGLQARLRAPRRSGRGTTSRAPRRRSRGEASAHSVSGMSRSRRCLTSTLVHAAVRPPLLGQPRSAVSVRRDP